MRNTTLGSTVTAWAINGAGLYNAYFCGIGGPGAVTAITIAAGSGLSLFNCSIAGQGATAISGAGTLSYSNLSFDGTATTISTTTQTPLLDLGSLPYTNVNASPYVAIDQDQFLSVDTSAVAITIQLPNAPTRFRPYIVKDRTGTAAARNITVTTPGGAVLFDGAATNVIGTNYGTASYIFNGTGYEKY